jgi:GAF domain-containing protein
MEDPVLPRDDWKRERDVFNLYAAFRDIPHVDLGASSDTDGLPSNFVPRPASDASLAAFAQLAAFRLNAQRSVISLLDGQYQYILAEATKTTSLRANSPLNNSSDLWLGSARVLRSWGLCDKVLDPVALNEGDQGIVLIKNLSQIEQYANRKYVKDGPKFRFYAGVPILSANNTIVGSLCILDGPGRTDMSSDEILYMQDLASTIMEYLDIYTLRDQHRRGAEGLEGLISFAEGDLSIQPFDEESHLTQLSARTGPVPTDSGERELYEQPEQNQPIQSEIAQSQAPSPSPTLSPSSKRASPQWSDSVSGLQGMVLPNTTRSLFARAADILRKCRHMDGVMFLDASVAATVTSGGDTPTRTR